MFGIGGFELFIILLFGFLIFGPDKLPEMAKTLGAALRKFKQAQSEMESVIKNEVLDADDKQNKQSQQKRSKTKPNPVATQESFAERKARYDKERAERKEQEAIEANRQAMKQEAAKKAEAQRKTAVATEVQDDVPSKPEPSAMSSERTSTLTPEELFGSKPITPSSASQTTFTKPQPSSATHSSAPAGSERGE